MSLQLKSILSRVNYLSSIAKVSRNAQVSSKKEANFPHIFVQNLQLPFLFMIRIEKFHTQLTNRSNANSLSDRATFPGYKGEFSTNLEFLYPENMSLIQCYRVMNRKGVVLDPSQDPQVNYTISKTNDCCASFKIDFTSLSVSKLSSTKKHSRKSFAHSPRYKNWTLSCTKRNVKAESRFTCQITEKWRLNSAQLTH